ncbi:phage holin family protein [Streptomyces himalayensis]|uniref:Phage holin family protein n=2 Tax=Streptomyces himalayensis TaxID=2820085 RepID=A0A7W2D868_9ACTN|nr:phage holin family protein [Streptomyces himalayensis]MBA2945082.1 phage holin family protein [Streptomyces himalayensis subsp. himalayensis]MBA4866577.1 phage holin family protein [Streptomyces himalayensis subsp. aureolus]
MSAPDGPVGADRSIGQLFASASSEMSALVHDEIALAKAQLRQDVKRGAVGGGAFAVAGAVLIFSLPMLSFALAYGINAWSGWHLSVCFLLSFAANVLLAGLLALIGTVFAKKAKKGGGPQKTVASAKETAAVLQKAKPHPRAAVPASSRLGLPEGVGGKADAVARSSS